MEPVGITKASASNARNRRASVKAITRDSTVSLPKPSGPRTTSCSVGPSTDFFEIANDTGGLSFLFSLTIVALFL